MTCCMTFLHDDGVAKHCDVLCDVCAERRDVGERAV